MNHDEHLNDSALTRELHDSLSGLAVPERPPLAAITSRGRGYQRRRLAGFAGLGVAGVAAGTMLALALTGILGAAPARSTGTIRTAAFTLTRNANGTDTLALTRNQVFDPAALQRALAQHGIPALVKIDTYCRSSPAAPDPHSAGVLSVQPPGLRRGAVPVPGGLKPMKPLIVLPGTAINPAAMPPGTELFFGYFNSHGLFSDLIHTSSYTCSNAQQPPRGSELVKISPP
jgi:hypothetical protein